MDMRDLQLIQLLSEEKSLKNVAKRLQISAPAVTQRLDKIENELEQILFYRNNDGGLTEAGKIVCQCATSVLNQMAATRQKLNEHTQNKMVLRLAVNPSIAMSDLLDVFERIKTIKPHFKPCLSEGTAKQIIHGVQNRSLDAGILVGHYEAQGIQLTPYRMDRFCAIAPIDHPLSHLKTASLKTVLSHPIIGSSSKQATRYLAELAKANNVTIHYSATASNFELQMALVTRTSYGIAIVAESIAKRFLESNPIKIINLDTPFEPRQFYLCTPEIGYTSDAAILFKQMLIDRFKTYY